MANVKTNTIIIRDETRGTSSSKQVTKKDFTPSGTLKPKRNVITNASRGRPASGTSAELTRFDRARPFTTLFNKLTGGAYERTRRGLRAAENWSLIGYGVGFNLLSKMVIDATTTFAQQFTSNLLNEARDQNNKDSLRFRTGDIRINGDYKVSSNFFTGRVTYKSNR